MLTLRAWSLYLRLASSFGCLAISSLRNAQNKAELWRPFVIQSEVENQNRKFQRARLLFGGFGNRRAIRVEELFLISMISFQYRYHRSLCQDPLSNSCASIDNLRLQALQRNAAEHRPRPLSNPANRLSRRTTNYQLISSATAKMQKSCMRTGKALVNNTPLKRSISDIAITRTGKPIIRTQGGRSVMCQWTQLNSG